LTHSIRNLLEGEFRFVHIQGEVSNLKTPFSGHLYFTLKDSDAQLKAVLFKGQRKYLIESLRDGQHVICHGRISVYEPRGEYQLVVDTVDFLGTGLLQLQFEKQKQRLAAEGLFAREIKKTLPAFPREIVLITSPSGAAVHDFLTICKKRKTSAGIRILPVRVQGEGAAEEIAAAIARVNKEIGSDVIVICRGGGSLEDLWAFNEECVARAIYDSQIPIVTGIGHEIDFTIADFCADFRAPTPTGAAEKIIPDNIGLLAGVEKLRGHLIAAIQRKLITEGNRIAYSRRLLGDLSSFLVNRELKLDACLSALIQSIKDKLSRQGSTFLQLTRRLQHQAPVVKIRFQQQRLDYLEKSLGQQLGNLIERKAAMFLQLVAKLDSMSPLATLARGYAIVSKNEHTAEPAVISDSRQVKLEDRLAIRLHRGRLLCEVVKKSDS
jgi:exodeoxyribonuclease VII large subunit